MHGEVQTGWRLQTCEMNRIRRASYQVRRGAVLTDTPSDHMTVVTM